MKRFFNQVWQEDDGVLSFEWVLLLTLLVIGIVGGIAAARDAIIDELADIAQAAVALDQSYTLEGIDLDEFVIPPQGFEDAPSDVVTCTRGGPLGQPQLEDENG